MQISPLWAAGSAEFLSNTATQGGPCPGEPGVLFTLVRRGIDENVLGQEWGNLVLKNQVKAQIFQA